MKNSAIKPLILSSLYQMVSLIYLNKSTTQAPQRYSLIEVFAYNLLCVISF